MNRKLSINLYIGEHHFPLTVTSEEEEILRKAAKLLDDKLKFWQGKSKYASFPKDKMMAGAALTVIAELLEQNKVAGKDKIERELEDIRITLEDCMLSD